MKWLDCTNMPPEPQAEVEDDAVVRLDDVDDGLHQRGRGEELAVVLRALHGEFHQEVFVDPAEDIAAWRCAAPRGRRCAGGLRAPFARNCRKSLGSMTPQRLERFLDGVHGCRPRRRRDPRPREWRGCGRSAPPPAATAPGASRSRAATSFRFGILPAAWSSAICWAAAS